MTRFIRTPHLKLLALTGAALLAVTACGGADAGQDTEADNSPAAICDEATANPDWRATLQAARSEGSVEVWSSVNQKSMDRLEGAFNATCAGITANITTYGVSDMTVRVDAEHDASKQTVDALIQSGTDWFTQRQPEGYFTAISGPAVSAALEAVAGSEAPPASQTSNPAEAQTNTLLSYDDTRLLTLLGPWGYAWNKDAVDEPAFEEVIDGSAGRVGMVDPATAPVLTLLYMKLEERYPDLYENLSKTRPQIYPTVAALAQALSAGEVDVALGIDEATISPLPNLGFAFDENNPPLATPVYAAMLQGAPKPNAAKVFVNWLASPEGQAVLTKGYVAPLPGVTEMSIADVNVFEVVGVEPATLSGGLATINGSLGR